AGRPLLYDWSQAACSDLRLLACAIRHRWAPSANSLSASEAVPREPGTAGIARRLRSSVRLRPARSRGNEGIDSQPRQGAAGLVRLGVASGRGAACSCERPGDFITPGFPTRAAVFGVAGWRG